MLEAFGNKIIVKVIEKEAKTSGFIAADLKKSTLLKGEVLSVGELVPVDYDLDKGSIVYFSVYGAEECEGNIIITDEQIYARLATGETQE